MKQDEGKSGKIKKDASVYGNKDKVQRGKKGQADNLSLATVLFISISLLS